MQKYKKPRYFERDVEKNPFKYTLVVPVIKWENKEFYKVDEDGDTLHASYLIEYEKVTKVYKSSERRKLINKLSGNSAKLYLWIMQELEYNADYLWINRKRYMEENNIKSSNTYRAAIKELQIQNIIQPTVIKDIYWINPAILFSGNRIKKYPNNLKIIQDQTQ